MSDAKHRAQEVAGEVWDAFLDYSRREGGYTPKPCATNHASNSAQIQSGFVQAVSSEKPELTPMPDMQPDFVPCERTVRAIAEKIQGLRCEPSDEWNRAWNHGVDAARFEANALLPKKDRAEELADKWLEDADWPDMGVRIAVIEYTAHLIAQGEIRG